jgi:hypothetical protein
LDAVYEIFPPEVPRAFGESLVAALRELDPSTDSRKTFLWKKPTRSLILLAWSALDRDAGLPTMEAALRDSWAGTVLDSMIEHEKERQLARIAHEERCARDRRRREAMKLERQKRHKERLMRKAERDRSRQA